MYTDEGKVEKYLSVDIGTEFGTQISDWILAVSAYIDNYCGKTFDSTAGGVASDRYFAGSGTGTLLLDTFYGTATVSILNDDGTVDRLLTVGQDNDFIAGPQNSTAKSYLLLTSGVFPFGASRVKVNATWGYGASVPKPVELAATMLVGEIIREGLKGGKLSSIALGDYNASFQKIDEVADPLGVFNILDMYRDIEV